jgi:hypothetical protein
MATTSLASIMRDHVALSTSCIDRLYLNGYVPTLQTPGQVSAFLHDHLGFPIPSPALFRPLHERFVQTISRFAQQHGVPLVHFERGQRKDDVAAGYRRRSSVSDGVVFIGVAQERAFASRRTSWSGRASRTSPSRASRCT